MVGLLIGSMFIDADRRGLRGGSTGIRLAVGSLRIVGDPPLALANTEGGFG